MNVPAGAATWDESLVVTKALSIIGAGSGNTVITSTIGSVTDALIEYAPPAAENGLFRVSGFHLDGNESSLPIMLSGPGGGAVVRNVRVDNNILTGITGSTSAFLRITGTVYGVADNNVGYGKGSVEEGDQYSAFDSLPSVFGNADNFYFEDNTITHIGNNFFTSGHGSRFAVRYNTMINETTGTNVFDVHGNMKGPTATNMIFEGYGNYVDNTGGSLRLAYAHGGKNLIFYNDLEDDSSIVVDILEFFDDGLTGYALGGSSSSGTSITMGAYGFPEDAANVVKVVVVYGTGLGQERTITARSSTTEATMDSAFSPNIDTDSYVMAYYFTGDKSKTGRVQHVNDTYIWNNRAGSNALITGDVTADAFFLCDSPCEDVENDPPVLVEDSAWWDDAVSFDGTSGVGCGNATAFSAFDGDCTAGVGYWVTDQSCANTTNMTGVNPATPINGTLYKCAATNVWSAYYTPYTYPHPLRGRKWSAGSAIHTPGSGIWSN